MQHPLLLQRLGSKAVGEVAVIFLVLMVSMAFLKFAYFRFKKINLEIWKFSMVTLVSSSVPIYYFLEIEVRIRIWFSFPYFTSLEKSSQILKI